MTRVAEFVKNLKFEDLDQGTIQTAKACLLDFIGAVLGGAETKAGDVSLRFAKIFCTSPAESTIWCTGEKTSPFCATFLHGTIGSALDIDDGHRMAVGHPGGVIIPAVISIAEEMRRSGREVIEALVCGYEVGIRSGNISIPISAGSGRWGSLGAAVAVAKLLSLDLEEIQQALNISATFTPAAPVEEDLQKFGFMPMTKFSSGWGGVVGICSAFLSKEGFTGISSTVDFSLSSLADFGQSFEIKNVYFKPYTSCRYTHPAIEGILQLMKDHRDITKDTIARIVIRTFSKAAHLKEVRPRTMESAQYSIPFLLGAAVIDGRVTHEQIVEDRLSNPEVLSIADRVEIIHKQELDNFFPREIPTEVTVETTLGRQYTTKVNTPKGDPKNPIHWKELIDKFRELTKKRIPQRIAEEVIKKVEDLEKLGNIAELTHLFGKIA
jgi:2-methylcitrate dehydratase PrpD